MIFQSLLPLNLGSVGMGQKEWRLIQIPKAKRINSHYLNGGKLAIPMFWIWNFGQTMKTDMDEMKWSSIDIYFSFLTYVLRKIKFILGINLQKKQKWRVFLQLTMRLGSNVLYIWSNYYSFTIFWLGQGAIQFSKHNSQAPGYINSISSIKSHFIIVW